MDIHSRTYTIYSILDKSQWYTYLVTSYFESGSMMMIQIQLNLISQITELLHWNVTVVFI